MPTVINIAIFNVLFLNMCTEKKQNVCKMFKQVNFFFTPFSF